MWIFEFFCFETENRGSRCAWAVGGTLREVKISQINPSHLAGNR